MNRRTLNVIIITCISLTFITSYNGFSGDTAYDWPRWRGPNGGGISTETNWDPKTLAMGPKIVWKVYLRSGHSNVVIKNNRLYTMGVANVFCFNAKTGKKIWQYTFERFDQVFSTPAIDDKYVYALSGKGIIVCLKAKNGKLRWKKDLVKDLKSPQTLYGYAGSPIVEGDLIILNAKTSGIALNKMTGDLIWEGEVHTDRFGDYFATPVMYNHDDKRHALIFSDSGLFSMDVETGGLVWFYEWIQRSGPKVADPVVFDNKVFLSHSETHERCVLLDISGNEPSVLWQNENMSNHVSTCVYIDGYLYGVHGDYYTSKHDCTLRCIDAKTGNIMWIKEMGAASLIAADGKLIILKEDGTLHIAEATPSSYQEISNCDVFGGEHEIRQFWTHPVVCNGKVYCSNYNGDLVCIDVSESNVYLLPPVE